MLLNLLRRLRLEDFAKDYFWKLVRAGRFFVQADRKVVNSYLGSHRVRKLHIGCGKNFLQGWLNSDYHPRSGQILFLDVTKPFPFENDVFDFIFSEHLIEHLTYAQGFEMLAECRRVLRPRGRLRLATPDLMFLIELFKGERMQLKQEYIRWATDTYVVGGPGYYEAAVINNFMRAWGHKFVYDEKVLRHSLGKVGFVGITKRNLWESDDEELKNLENESRMPEGFLRLETMILEATKPWDSNQ